MKYNFDTVISRKNTDSLKYDALKKYFGKEDLIPLWVADMDFKICPIIQKKLSELIDHGIFGYPVITDKYYHSVCDWQKENYKLQVNINDIIFTTGVVSSIKHLINIFSKQNDNILVQTPVYNPFFSIIKQTKRNVLINRLIENKNSYIIDFNDFRKKAKIAKIFILCNPHNPVGRVWTREELIEMAKICLENNVIIISDEIHSDFTYENNFHIPIVSLGDELKKITITCNSPTKSFNLASLKISYLIIMHKVLKEQINNYMSNYEIDSPTIFGLEALYASYNFCKDWLTEAKSYIYENYLFLKKYINEEIPFIKLFKLEGTYLAWIDFRELQVDNKTINDIIINKAKVALNNGNLYGPGGDGFQRINLATPRKILYLALSQLNNALKSYIK